MSRRSDSNCTNTANAQAAFCTDLALFSSTATLISVLLLIGLTACLPLSGSSYILDVANRCGIAIIAAIGLNILTGYTGLISLGNAAFMAIGGFSAGFLATKTGINTLYCIPLAGAITALLGMIIGIPSLRLKGLYLAMATLAAHFIVEFLSVKWESVTGGVAGISIPAPSLAGLQLDNDRRLFYLIFGAVLLVVLFVVNLFRTRTGRAFIAIRDHETAAGVMGIDVFRYKLTAFGLSSFFVGVAGALTACQAKIISPETFPFSLAIDSLAMIIIGGMGSVAGSILGALFLTLLPEMLRLATTALSGSYPALVGNLAPLKELIFSMLIIIFLVFSPHGIVSWWRRLTNRIGRSSAGQNPERR
jgi:branched-chain amino acid transport system permease protein